MSAVPVPRIKGEVHPGGGYCGQVLPTLGYLTMKAPPSCGYPIRPQRYSCGFDSHGKIIGSNVTVPYPGEFPKYHDIPFIKCVDWSAHIEPNTSLEQCKNNLENESVTEIDEYFTVENDEGYRQWAEKKSCEEKKKLEEKQKESKKIPEEIHQQPGHFLPTHLPTTNQTYGSYIDLLPKYPAVYPSPGKLSNSPVNLQARFEKSNISNHGRVTNHPFIMNALPSCTPALASHRKPGHQPKPMTYILANKPLTVNGQMGEREKGFTFPVFSHTGLELNRANLASRLSPIPEQVLPGKVTHVATHCRKHTYMPYCLRSPRGIRMNPNISNRQIVYGTVELPPLKE